MRLPLVSTEQDMHHLASQRQCGECTVCCVLPSILPESPHLEEGKRDYTSCVHLNVLPSDNNEVHSCKGSGCSVYSTRPDVCRGFSCLWKEGIIDGDERRRPDKLGIMFTTEESNGILAIEAWETRPGVFLNHPARGIIDAIAQRKHLAIRFYKVPLSLIYPPEHGTEFLTRGRLLSELAMNDPPVLAHWIRQTMAKGQLTCNYMDAMESELQKMENGGTSHATQP